MSNNEEITSKPRTLSELSNYYGVDTRTLKEWLMCETLKDIILTKKGYYFSILEVKRIIEHLG